MAFLSSVALWWLYFGQEATSAVRRMAADEAPGRVGRYAYTYLHLPIVAGILLTVVGDELVIAHPSDELGTAGALAVLGGPALYLLGLVAFSARVGRPQPWTRTAAAATLAACVPLAAEAQALAVAAAATALLTALSSPTSCDRHPHLDVALTSLDTARRVGPGSGQPMSAVPPPARRSHALRQHSSLSKPFAPSEQTAWARGHGRAFAMTGNTEFPRPTADATSSTQGPRKGMPKSCWCAALLGTGIVRHGSRRRASGIVVSRDRPRRPGGRWVAVASSDLSIGRTTRGCLVSGRGVAGRDDALDDGVGAGDQRQVAGVHGVDVGVGVFGHGSLLRWGDDPVGGADQRPRRYRRPRWRPGDEADLGDGGRALGGEQDGGVAAVDTIGEALLEAL